MSVHEGEERGRMENIFKDTVPENFPNLMETISPYQEVQLNPNHKNMNETTPQHVLIKLLKTSDNEKNFQTARKKASPPQNIYMQGNKDKDEIRFFIGSCETTFLRCGKKSCQAKIL